MRRRLLLSLLLSVVAFLLGSIPAHAVESKAIIALPSFDLESDYEAADVTIVYEENLAENSFEARVLDRESGETLEVVREIPELPLNMVNAMRRSTTGTRAQRTYDTTLQKDVVLASGEGKSIIATVSARVRVTSDHSWAQIDYVYECHHSGGGSGSYTLNTFGTYYNTQQGFPVVALKVDFNGVIEVKSSNTAGFSFKLLTNLGFSISGSSTSTWYARKSYNASTTFRVM